VLSQGSPDVTRRDDIGAGGFTLPGGGLFVGGVASAGRTCKGDVLVLVLFVQQTHFRRHSLGQSLSPG